jgi:anaphase-promoting complex subunit 1
MFDHRWDGTSDRALLAICLPSSGTLFIFSVTKSDDLRVIVQQHAKLSALSILTVRGIRHSCADLLVVKPDHSLCLLTHGTRELPLSLIPCQTSDAAMDVDGGAAYYQHHGNLVTVTHGAGTTFTAVFDTGARFRASLGLLPMDGVTLVCLRGLSMTLPQDEFFRLHAGFLAHWSRRGFSTAGSVELDCFVESLSDLLQLPSTSLRRHRTHTAVPESVWSRMSHARSRSHFEDDPAFANLVAPEVVQTRKFPLASSAPHPLTAPVLNSLHLLGEDCRLNVLGQHALMKLAPIICELALLVRPEWADYWKRFCPHAIDEWPSSSAASMFFLVVPSGVIQLCYSHVAPGRPATSVADRHERGAVRPHREPGLGARAAHS